MKFTHVGYFPRRTLKYPQGFPPQVREICSVSTCLSEDPDGWIERWQHNDLFFYDTPELAWSIVPEANRREYDLYSYFLPPVLYEKGHEKPLDIPPLRVVPLVGSWERLGFDVVSRHFSATFECSALSCNGMAERVSVNPYCLMEDLDAARRLAETCEAAGCEPGPYFIIELWRAIGQARAES